MEITREKWGQLIYIPLLLALAIRLFVIFHYGPYVSIHSDDMGYLRSAEWLLQYGTYSYYTPYASTVHMLPGMTLVLSAVIGVFGSGATGLYAAKIVFTLIGVLGIFGAYKVVSYAWNMWAGLVVAMFMAMYIPSIATDTLFLTEPPFMAGFAWTVYFVLKLADEHRLRQVIAAAVLFMVTVYFRPNVLLWLVVVLIYLIIKQYPFKKLIGHSVIVGGIIVVCMLPWWIRNEIVFHHFIALTDDSGNPLLLGTFQGLHSPAPNNLVKIEHQILKKHPSLAPQGMHEIPWFRLQQSIAVDRIRQWHHLYPADFWQSYLWIKPGILWSHPYYPIRILGVLPEAMKNVQHWLLWFSIAGHAVALVLGHKHRRQTVFIVLTLLYYTGLYSVYFAYGRYNEPIMWLMFLGIPTGVWALCTAVSRAWRGRTVRIRVGSKVG